MCVLGSLCLSFFFRDVFERSKCCLDPWLSCMFDCIHICVFLFLKNCFNATSTAPRHLSIPSLSVKPFCYCLSQSRHLSIARWIDRESFCPLDSFSIVVRSIETYLTAARHLSIHQDSLACIAFHMFCIFLLSYHS